MENGEFHHEIERRGAGEWLRGKLKGYRETFGLSEKDMKEKLSHGKRVLDIGAGDRRFAAACAVEGYDAQVWSLEPTLRTEHPEQYAPGMPEEIEQLNQRLPQEIQQKLDKRSVSASYEAMPFKDETFDTLVSHAAFPIQLETKEEMQKFFDESLRILKKGGEARFFPIQLEPKWRTDQWFADLAATLESLKKQGCTVERRTTQEVTTRTPEGEQRYISEVLIIKKGKQGR